jgi:hypothetical protein
MHTRPSLNGRHPVAPAAPADERIGTTSSTETDRKPTMAERITAEGEANPLCHTWVVAANVPVDHKTARRAAFRGSFRTEAGMRVDALEVICSSCRRPIDMVGDKDKCDGKVDNTHLIGGDPGVRAKRKVFAPVGQVIKQPLPSRNGLGGYSVHAGR